MTSSSKKITYTSEFKLKVLDYYFKHGGDENFGLKKKTAGHFNIDKKTINRMLNNPDMVKRARRLLAKRSTSSSKTSSSSTSTSKSLSSKLTSMKQSRKQVKGSKVATAAGGGKPGGGSGGGSGKAAGTGQSGGSGSAAGGGTAGITAATAGVAGTSGSGSAAASTASSARVRCVGQPGSSEGVKVLELPEDPDYSLLKRSINASANGVANVAKLLVTGTEEVRKLILNECEMILECKVCQNLFRSVVNFLAHKRIYCREEFSDVRTLFHRDNTQGITSQSGTLVVEPEPPPPSPPPPPDLQPQPLTPPPTASARAGRGIESIAERLAGRRAGGMGGGGGGSVPSSAAEASHPTDTGSSVYYERLELVNTARDKLSQDCSVVLEDIRGVTNARLQTFLPHQAAAAAATNTTTTATATLPHMSQLLEEVSRRGSGVTVALGEQGEVLMTAPGDVEVMEVEKPATPKQNAKPGHNLVCRLCNTRFATTKTLSVHQRSHHGLDRYVYSCPICQAAFVTMWGVIKHLEKLHKKTKHQIDRLKKVIRKNVTKKHFFPPSSLSLMGEAAGQEEEEEEEEPPDREFQEEGRGKEAAAAAAAAKSTNETVVGGESAVNSRGRASASGSSRKSVAARTTPKREESGGGGGAAALEHRCGKCERRFMTPQALISHAKFCSLQQMKPQSVLLAKSPLSPRLRSETPEKRIAIQIRKDYKKPVSPARNGAGDVAAHDAPGDGGQEGKVEEVMEQLCRLSSLTCVPCGRRYQTITTLKRHVSVHFNWTRYACRRCPFRSYNRYELTRHAVNHHGVTETAAAALLLEDVAFGPVKYFLTAEDNLEAGEGDGESDSPGTGPLPPVNDATVKVNGLEAEVQHHTSPEENKHKANGGWTPTGGSTGAAAAGIKQQPLPPHTIPKPKETPTDAGVGGETPQRHLLEVDGHVGERDGSSPPPERQQEAAVMAVEGQGGHHHHHQDFVVSRVTEHTATAAHPAPPTDKSRSARRKAAKRRRLNDLKLHAAATHNTCNGTHADETPGSYEFPEELGSAAPLVEERRKSSGNSDVHDNEVEVQCVTEGVVEVEGGGGGGVHHTVVQGEQGVS